MIFVTASFTAVGAGAPIRAGDGDRLIYRVRGTFVGTVVLERATHGQQAWDVLHTFSAGTAGVVELGPLACNETGTIYRFRCIARTSGTIETKLVAVESSVAIYQAHEDTFPVFDWRKPYGVIVSTGRGTAGAVDIPWSFSLGAAPVDQPHQGTRVTLASVALGGDDDVSIVATNENLTKWGEFHDDTALGGLALHSGIPATDKETTNWVILEYHGTTWSLIAAGLEVGEVLV